MTDAATWDQGAAAPDMTVRSSRRGSGGDGAPILRALAVITLTAAIVAVGGYVAGRYAAQLGAGQLGVGQRQTATRSAPPVEISDAAALDAGGLDAADVSTSVADASLSASSATSSQANAARLAGLGSDIDVLHPQVAAAVMEARRQRVGAEAAERRAQRAAARAQALTNPASGGDGVLVEAFDNGDVYEGEVADGVRDGVGVYTWANSIEGTYGGQFDSGVIAGLGVKRWADGAAYFGSRSPEARDGHGVFAYAQGGGYEGEWAMGAPDGYGVVWASDGSVQSQGLWASNVLVEAWVVPSSDEAGADGDIENGDAVENAAAESDAGR